MCWTEWQNCNASDCAECEYINFGLTDTADPYAHLLLFFFLCSASVHTALHAHHSVVRFIYFFSNHVWKLHASAAKQLTINITVESILSTIDTFITDFHSWLTVIWCGMLSLWSYSLLPPPKSNLIWCMHISIRSHVNDTMCPQMKYLCRKSKFTVNKIGDDFETLKLIIYHLWALWCAVLCSFVRSLARTHTQPILFGFIYCTGCNWMYERIELQWVWSTRACIQTVVAECFAVKLYTRTQIHKIHPYYFRSQQ